MLLFTCLYFGEYLPLNSVKNLHVRMWLHFISAATGTWNGQQLNRSSQSTSRYTASIRFRTPIQEIKILGENMWLLFTNIEAAVAVVSAPQTHPAVAVVLLLKHAVVCRGKRIPVRADRLHLCNLRWCY